MTEHTKRIMVGSEDFAELSFRDTSDESFTMSLFWGSGALHSKTATGNS